MADKMTQAQVVSALANHCELTKVQVKSVLNALVEIATKEVKKNGEFTLPGFGKLKRRESKARMGRNPATGEAIKIPARKTVKFFVGKALKEAIVPPKKK